MTELVSKTLAAQYKRFVNHLLAALEWFIEHIVRKAVRSPLTIAEVTEGLISNSGTIAPTVAFIKSKERKHTDERGKIEDR